MEITPRLVTVLAYHRILYEVRRVPDKTPPLDLPGRLGLPPRSLVKTVPFHHGTEVALLVIPIECELDPKRVEALFGAQRSRPYSAEETAHYFPDCEPAAIPPVGEPYGATVYLDRCVPIHRKISFHGGSSRQLIRLPYPVFDLLVQPLHVGICLDCQGCGMAKVISVLRR